MKQYRNPTPTVDVILERDSNVLMVRRKKDPFKDFLSLPGGFVNEGETVEDAMKREAMEETSLEVHPIDILGVYSDPRRDPKAYRDHSFCWNNCRWRDWGWRRCS